MHDKPFHVIIQPTKPYKSCKVLSYPRTRLRRNRKSQWSRDLFVECNLKSSDLIMPLFVIDGNNIIEAVTKMEGVFRYSIDKLVDKVQSLHDDGIRAIMLFPYISCELKDIFGKESLNSANLICRAIEKIKQHVPQIGVIADVALDPYTSHGFDGILNDQNDVDNDGTIEILCKQSLILANAGADVIAPSDMMDGRVGKIRDVLEAEKYFNVQIFSYSVKYASHFYDPFREAIGSSNNLGKGNKKTYFLNYCNRLEAMSEIECDISEGADAIIIKPGGMYLDVIYQASNEFRTPILAYQVSGEYAMLKNAADKKFISEREAVLEVLHSFKRSGARSIITYYADRVSKWIT